MAGQKNLKEVLSSMQVSCDNVEYAFATIRLDSIVLEKGVLGIFTEKEGLTIIASKGYFENKQIPFEGPFAKLTIEVHTSLNLVGLTAILATKLAENEISANVIAGYFHDHIFVQYDLREKAIAAINQLKN